MKNETFNPIILFLFFTGAILGGCASGISLPFTPASVTPSPSATVTPSPTLTPTPSLTPTPTLTPTSTATPTPWYAQPEDIPMAYQYARVLNTASPIYGSLDDALIQFPVHLHSPGIEDSYVSYKETVDRGPDTYYRVDDNGWMYWKDLEPVRLTKFRGILLPTGVNFRFGWVLEDTLSSAEAPAQPQTYLRYSVIREDPTQAARPGMVAVGPSEWLPETALSLVNLQTTPPAGVSNCRWVVADLIRQNLVVYENCQPIFASLISSGRDGTGTAAGLFSVYYTAQYHTLYSPEYLNTKYYLEDVPFLISYYEAFAIHGAYWHDDFGMPASHGCINMAPVDARWLFNWVKPGEKILIQK